MGAHGCSARATAWQTETEASPAAQRATIRGDRYWQAPDADEDSRDRSADAPLPDARPPTPIARSRGMAHDLYRRMRTAVRDSRARALFGAYRPYEQYEPGPLSPNIAATVQRHGFSYMLSKSGFGTEPRVLLQSGPFVVLNYTAGRWDGWTPFETINDVSDLRTAERRLRNNKQPAWLLGGIDTCLWTFSGELWRHAPGLEAIASFVANGGSSGALINVTPRVIARYARLLAETGRVPQAAVPVVPTEIVWNR